VYTSAGDGINISANHITEEVVEKCHRKGMRIGVWVRAKDYQENEEFYEQMFQIGTDFICADQPLKAMASREKYFKRS
jgi:glycerophosphoryl diester phosphodiesterase